MFGAIDLDWSFLANVGAVLGGLAILLLAFGLVNRMRDRPFWSLPETVSWPELGAFVLVPALLPLIFGGQTTSALVTVAVNLALVALVYLVVGYAIVWIVVWAFRRLLSLLAASLSLLSRAVPLLLVFALVLFVNTEMWQVFSTVPEAFLWIVGAIFLLLASAFIAARLPREVRALERETDAGPPLDRRQRLNVGLVMFVSQALQVLVVAAAVGGFFVVFGAFAVGEQVRKSWEVVDGATIVNFTFLGDSVQITEALLRVSGGIAAFSALYYAIAVLTDSTYREEFRDELTRELREVFHARAEYLAATSR